MRIMFSGTAIVLSFLSLLLLSPLAFSEKCNPQDKKVLLKIKQELNNPYVLATWNPKTDCCHWHCVKCDLKTHRITELFIQSSVPDTNLSGHIPPSVGDLPYLRSLQFQKLPRLTGPIPPTIAKLKNLTFLFIENTSVSGPIPSFLSQLKNLEFLHLSTNNLTGSIPSSLSKLPNLQSIHLDRNKLEGDASVLFGSKKRIQRLDVSRNMLSFDLSKVDFPKKSLTSLDLSHNKIYGKIPVALTKVENLQQFNVSYNTLSGQIPQGGELQKRFDVYAYCHNKDLCGSPLPACKK